MSDTDPFVIVGLGNPGEKYVRSRHNMGRVVLSEIAKTLGLELIENGKSNAHRAEGIIAGHRAVILLPNTYMNKSGASVRTAIPTKEDASRLILVYDELDLPWGTIRIAYGRGSGGHNGVDSVIKSVGTKNFVRVRVGVGPTDAEGVLRKPRGGDAVLSYIMGNFGTREESMIPPLAARVHDALVSIMEKGHQATMNTVNAT